MKKKWSVRRWLAGLLAAAMTVTMMPAAWADGTEATYTDGTYETTSDLGFGGSRQPVEMKVTIRDGKITELVSPKHEGESFWDADVDALLQRIVDMENNIEMVGRGLKEDGNPNGIDAASGATYSSRAVIDAVQKAIEEARIKDSTDDPAEVHYAQASLLEGSFIAPYTQTKVYDKTFVNPYVSYTIDDNGDYVFTLTVQPASEVQLYRWDDSKLVDLTAADFTGIQYNTYSYQRKAMTMVESDAAKGTKKFQFTLPGSEVSTYMSRTAFQLTFEVTEEKQMENMVAFPLTAYMAIDLTADEPPVPEETYVLMNIPYDEFYAAELGASDPVDAVTAATRNGKARNVNVNGASYHQSEEAVTTEGIAGAMYPVRVASLDDLKALGGKEITDADKVSYEMNARGQVSTVDLEGPAALQESPSYSWYVLSEAPAAYKELTVTDGKASFSEAKGIPVTGEATGEATIGGRHTEVEIPLSGVDVAPADVSGVVITAGEHSYALHHVVNIWRGTEIGWNLSDIDLGGETITKIRYLLKDGTIQDYTANIPVAEAGYVLMNIPYADFYKAELGENDPAVDAVSSSTKNKPRTGTLAGGSYHQNADGSDISGVIYPAFVKDMRGLEGLTEITDASSVTISVTNRGTTSETTYSGKEALFESANYSYYRLDEKPARYKTLTIEADGTKTFSAVSGRATTVSDATGAVNEAGHHADVEIRLSSTTGIEAGQAVSGVVVTFEDGTKLGLRHVTEIWRATELGGSAADFAGKKITNVRYYTQDSVIDFPMEISVKKKAADATAEFTDASTISMTGLPEDLENAKATVQTQVGRGETATVIAEEVDVKDGVITATEAAENGKTYSISIQSDNYLPINTTAVYNAPHEDICPSKNFTDVNPDPDFWYHEAVDYVVSKGMMNGTGETTFAPIESTNRAMIVTVLYRLEGEPEAQPSAFTDLEAGSWYEAAVNWAAEKGIVQGMSETRFAPKDTLTRQQIATILYRYAAYKGADVSGAADLSSYTDASAVSSWAQKEMSWAVQSGLMKGTTETTLDPSGDATRAQIAVLMQRLCEEILSGIEPKAE